VEEGEEQHPSCARVRPVCVPAQGLLAHQAHELGDVNKLFAEETAKLVRAWKGRVKEYELAFTASVEELRALHEQQQQQLYTQMQGKLKGPRPSKVNKIARLLCHKC